MMVEMFYLKYICSDLVDRNLNLTTSESWFNIFIFITHLYVSNNTPIVICEYLYLREHLPGIFLIKFPEENSTPVA